jgi:hypothetical protein
MANPYLHRVDFHRTNGKSSTINSCKSLAKYLAYHLCLADGQIAVTKGITTVYIYFVKHDKLHTVAWNCIYASWSEEAAEKIVDFIKNIP